MGIAVYIGMTTNPTYKRQSERYYYIRQCSTCKGIMGITWLSDECEDNHETISHGLCSNCKVEVYKEFF